MPTTVEWKVVRVPADHPAWNAIDDDDWNGHTFANWLRKLMGSTVVIWPPPGYDNERLGRFLTALMNAGADRIVRGVTYPPGPDDFCHECLPLAQDIDWSLKEHRDTMKRLADAAEAALAADPAKLGDWEETMDTFENTVDEARQLLREGT
jgi:hypothetical protein